MLATGGVLDNRGRDIVALVALGIAAVGFPLTFLGVIFVWSQARQARTSAQAAKEATEATRQSLVNRMRLATLNQALASLNHLRELIRQRDFRSARQQLEALRTGILELRESEQAQSPQMRRDFQRHLTALSSLEDAVDDQLDNADMEWEPSRLRDTLRPVIDFLQTLEVQTRLHDGGS